MDGILNIVLFLGWAPENEPDMVDLREPVYAIWAHDEAGWPRIQNRVKILILPKFSNGFSHAYFWLLFLTNCPKNGPFLFPKGPDIGPLYYVIRYRKLQDNRKTINNRHPAPLHGQTAAA